ncbi:PKD domain-containing protein [Arthrobacter sp. M4]|uniref:PKD domain-containing protein n=1 Tax=Arthrobacter sp. M4 TaxID=218160 RepID=UPI001CDC1CCD|nr:PKD domain-containing protein [Arthrobacter sp. M4]MCA4133946.1 PKD domain-containing protein [Arthrobacter sp. M4]
MITNAVRRYWMTLCVVGLLTLSQLLCPSLVSASETESDLGFQENGLGVGGRVRHPGTGRTIAVDPRERSDDPNQYKAEFLCKIDQLGRDAACRDSLTKCPRRDDGKGGYLAVWKVAPKGIENPRWDDWKSTEAEPFCFYDDRPDDVLQRIRDRILSDFRQLPINAGTVASQPSPHTLRGAETNFYANTIEQQFDVTILGQKVRIVATPVEYTWNYGDGTVVGPQPSAGGALPEGQWGEKTRTSHAYAQTGDFSVVLTSHFRGTYSVNGGPPLPIPGQGSFSSAPVTVSVWRSVTRNYADNCMQNQQGDGCPAGPFER